MHNIVAYMSLSLLIHLNPVNYYLGDHAFLILPLTCSLNLTLAWCWAECYWFSVNEQSQNSKRVFVTAV